MLIKRIYFIIIHVIFPYKNAFKVIYGTYYGNFCQPFGAMGTKVWGRKSGEYQYAKPVINSRKTNFYTRSYTKPILYYPQKTIRNVYTPMSYKFDTAKAGCNNTAAISPITNNTTTAIESTFLNQQINQIKTTKLSPLTYILQDEDLVSLAEAIRNSEVLDEDSFFTRVAMTVFAPVNAAFDRIPFEIKHLSNTSKSVPLGRNYTYIEDIFAFHVVAPRLLKPQMIRVGHELKLLTRDKKQFVNVTRIADEDTIIVNNVAKVVEIIKAKRGYIYKIDTLLSRKWNSGPKIEQFINESPNMTKMRWLMERTTFIDDLGDSGPVTIFLIPDDGWKTSSNDIPHCFFEALVRPENRNRLDSLMRWLTVPGLWKQSDISNIDWLYNIENPKLYVTHVTNAVTNYVKSATKLSNYTRNLEIKDSNTNLTKSINSTDNTLLLTKQTNTTTLSLVNNSTITLSLNNTVDRYNAKPHLLIESISVKQWDIQLFNGVAHILSRLPKSNHMDISSALWDCTHEFCYNCPAIVKSTLLFLDRGGLLPATDKPNQYIVPPGPRPQWVCRGASKWFPPGWDPIQWETYLKTAKRNSGRAKYISLKANRAASRRMAILKDNLEKAKIELHKIEFSQKSTSSSIRKKHDPINIYNKFKSKIKNTELPPNCKKEQPGRKLTMQDLKYLARWK